MGTEVTIEYPEEKEAIRLYGGDDIIDGGEGFDTLKTNGDLDLTTLADNLLRNIEKIDITGMENVDNTLTLSSSDITALGGFDTGNGRV